MNLYYKTRTLSNCIKTVHFLKLRIKKWRTQLNSYIHMYVKRNPSKKPSRGLSATVSNNHSYIFRTIKCFVNFGIY